MKIIKFNVPAILKKADMGLIVDLDHSKRKEVSGEVSEEFNVDRLVLKSQEVDEFNKGEIDIIKSFQEPGEYNCEFKLIVE